MSFLTVKHFSHSKHPLVLKEDVIIGVDATCSVCTRPVIGSSTYTCSSSDDIDCQIFYLHKICAELPKTISRDKKHQHPLTLLQRSDDQFCDVCTSRVKFAYACEDCIFDLCVFCAFNSSFLSEQGVIHHQGHEHKLTLQRQALFKCDACWEEVKDYSYVCFTCDFWIHKKCAFSPLIIPDPTYHHHPLNLILSIPVMHRYFTQYCPICKKQVEVFFWSYYCHKCTFFVHMECSTSTVSLVNEFEENGIVDDEPDLVQIPLPDDESLFDLIIRQCTKFQVEIQGEGENSANISTIFDDPHIIGKHWSHRAHPLELHQFTVGVNDNDDDDNDNDDDRRVLICDGCIQPITTCHPCYYACIQCGFFLHSFCATKLPRELPAGGSPFHPQHSLFISQRYNFDLVKCQICSCSTNGFFYECEPCDIKVDIRCAFLPERIRHKSHKHHSLVQRPFSNSLCSASNLRIDGREYACKTCSSYQIDVNLAFYPSKLRHRYDDHSLMLRYPPFFYEGMIYCQTCEERVNNQNILYHCEECDQSFHFNCVQSSVNVKVGGTIKHIIGNQPHTLTMVLKHSRRRNCSPYLCGVCGHGSSFSYFLECKGCGYLACISCVRSKKIWQSKI